MVDRERQTIGDSATLAQTKAAASRQAGACCCLLLPDRRSDVLKAYVGEEPDYAGSHSSIGLGSPLKLCDAHVSE